jgi:hypothetical protein
VAVIITAVVIVVVIVVVVVVVIITITVAVVVSGVPKVSMALVASNHNGHPLKQITNVIKKHNHLLNFFLFPSIPLNLFGGGAEFSLFKIFICGTERPHHALTYHPFHPAGGGGDDDDDDNNNNNNNNSKLT